MTTLLKNAMMYRAVKAECNVNFQKSFFELPSTDIYHLGLFAELFNVKPRNGWSPARTLFYRLAEYEEKNIRNI